MSFTIEQISFTGATALTIGISTAVYLFYRRKESTDLERLVMSLMQSSQVWGEIRR